MIYKKREHINLRKIKDINELINIYQRDLDIIYSKLDNLKISDEIKESISELNDLNINCEVKTALANLWKKEIDFTPLITNTKYYCFLTSSILDLLIVLKGLLKSKYEWDEIFYSKTSFLIIYESVNTYHSYQKGLKNIIGKNENLFLQYRELNVLINNFKKMFGYDIEMAQMRNNAIGHFNKNYSNYYNQIKKLNKEQCISMVIEFAQIFFKILFFNNLVLDVSVKEFIDKAEIISEKIDFKKEEFLNQLKELKKPN